MRLSSDSVKQAERSGACGDWLQPSVLFAFCKLRWKTAKLSIVSAERAFRWGGKSWLNVRANTVEGDPPLTPARHSQGGREAVPSMRQFIHTPAWSLQQHRDSITAYRQLCSSWNGSTQGTFCLSSREPMVYFLFLPFLRKIRRLWVVSGKMLNLIDKCSEKKPSLAQSV